jgi:adenosylcobinamide kinase/adenosylcobinamide-phosphate guanylyltransferase
VLTTLLVLGGARSGKSRYAEARAIGAAGQRLYIATAQAFDEEMRERIARHRADRGEGWRTIETPIALAETIVAEGLPDRVLLVDCLTLWASNLMHAGADIAQETLRLTEAIGRCPARLILVSNEVGLGIVPDNALARRFRDEAGRINQAVAAACSEVVFVAAGLPLTLKTP